MSRKPDALFPELRLVPISIPRREPRWPAAVVHSDPVLDPACWLTRGARGLSWNPNGKSPARRRTH